MATAAVSIPVALVYLYLFVDEGPPEGVIAPSSVGDEGWPIVEGGMGRVFWPVSPVETHYFRLEFGSTHESDIRIEQDFESAVEAIRRARKARWATGDGKETRLRRKEIDEIENFAILLSNHRAFACDLREFSPELISGAPGSDDAVMALRALYAASCQSLSPVQPGEYRFYASDLPEVWSGRIFFLPNQYIRLTSEAAQTMVRNASKPVIEWDAVDLPPYTWEGVSRWLRFLPMRNGVGKVFAREWVDRARHRLEEMIELRVETLLVGTWIGLESYRQEEGKLPSALGDLVPRYLKAVPLDSYDGEPLRYSAEKGIIYSVGADFIDSGGSRPHDWLLALRYAEEPTLRVDRNL